MTYTDEATLFSTGYAPGADVLTAELAVAGAAITRKHLAEAAAEIVTPDHFHQQHAAIAYRAALHLAGSGAWVDIASVGRYLTQTGGMTAFRDDLTKLFDLGTHAAIASSANGVRYHAVIVAEDAARRRLHQACTRGLQMASSPAFDPTTDIEQVVAEVQAVATGGSQDQPLMVGDDFEAYLNTLEQPDRNPVVPTPWADVDRIAKIRGGQLVIIGARPGGGKSLAGLGIATHTAIRRGRPAAVFSMEMPRHQVMDRVMASQACVSLTAFEERSFAEWDWRRIAEAKPKVEAAPLLIDDTPHLTAAHIRTRLRWMAGRGTPAEVIVIDYLQLMHVDSRSGESRVQQLGALSRALKLLAIEFNIPVIALTQLNRASEGRHDKRPQMSDLRESGSIENDADMVLLLHRPEEPTEEEQIKGARSRVSEVDVIVAKNRQGPNQITVPLSWQGHWARLSNLAKDHG